MSTGWQRALLAGGIALLAVTGYFLFLVVSLSMGVSCSEPSASNGWCSFGQATFESAGTTYGALAVAAGVAAAVLVFMWRRQRGIEPT